jgi:four helix bundle protein
VAGSFRDNIAWQKGMALVTEIYRLTEAFPSREIYGLTRQVRAAAVLVPSNIAEGKGRKTNPDYVQFLYRARGSILEVQTQLEVARNLKFFKPAEFEAVLQQANVAGRVLNGLIASVERQIRKAKS